MVWFHVDDGLAFHKKVMEAGNAALGLWVRAGAWSTGSLTDGFIPSAIARSIGTQKQIESLLECGLWARVSGGYQFHDWHHRQFTKDEVEKKREADRQRKAEQRKRRNVPPGHTAEVPPDFQAELQPEVRADSSRARALTPPHPTPPLNGNHLGRGTHVSSGDPEPDERSDQTAPPQQTDEPPLHCPRHPGGTADPCSACGTFRRKHDRWQEVTDRIRQQTADEQADADRQARLDDAASSAMAIAECELCDDDGYAGGRICHHNPGQADTNARGLALVRAAMANGTEADQ